MHRKALFLAVLAATITVAPSVFAQVVPGGSGSGQSGLANTLVLDLSPENPAPNSTVVVTVKTTFIDLQNASIGWLDDGKLTESGLGKTQHTVFVGGQGSKLTISAIVTDTDGSVYEKDITIYPETVDLIWESPSSVPPFYEGKALYTLLGKLVITALPRVYDTFGQLINPRDLVYTWKENSSVLGSQSGYGKSSLTVTDPIYRTPVTFSVHAATSDDTLAADGSVVVNTTQQSVLAYENNPLYGTLFNRTIANSFSLNAPEATLEAYPYYFTAGRSNLTYNWEVNGQNAQGFSGPFLTVRNVNDQSGSASVYLQVSDPTSYVQGATNGFTILFGTNSQ